jgi:hypothetical protein
MGAPRKRNQEIANYSDMALVFWDCKSKGTKHTINCFELLQKEIIKITI